MQLPLSLTPLETYYWYDDRDQYPTTFPFDLCFSGVLRREPLERALEVAVERHPMLRVLVDDSVGRVPRWIDAGGQQPQVDWADDRVPVAHADGERIDLTRQIGVRVFVRIGERTSRLLLQFHHACCDAVGAQQFVEDLLITYAASVSEVPGQSTLRPLEPDRLAMRGDFGLTAANYRPTLRDLWITLSSWTKWLWNNPAVVAVSQDNLDGPPLSFLGFCSHSIEREQIHQLRRVATSHGVTLNDVLLRDLFLTLQAWNVEHANRKSWRFRINVPTNLRDRPDQFMPAANVLSFAFVSRGSTDCSDPSELLRSVHAETEAIKRWRLGLYFVGGLAFASRVPGLMRWSLRHKGSFATAVLSYVGRIFSRTRLPRQDGKLVCGNVVLESATGVPPVRPGTRASIAVTLYGRSTVINLRCDPHHFNARQTQQLLEAYVRQLQETIRREG